MIENTKEGISMELVCPLCGRELCREEKSWLCEAGHRFDVARQGYVNLLAVQQKHSLCPGDTREQVLSRRAFLEAGHYLPISQALNQAALELGARGPILDVGCGEGYYSVRLAQAMNAELIGLDISKEAVRWAAGKYKGPTWLCATAAHIPVRDGSIGTLTSLFALTLPEEFRRVLGRDGLFFQVLAAEDHLLGLKSILYEELTHKEKNTVPALPGFQLVDSRPIRFSFCLEGEQIRSLFAMTPHLFRIGKAGAQRLAQTTHLQDTASCVLNVYRVT